MRQRVCSSFAFMPITRHLSRRDGIDTTNMAAVKSSIDPELPGPGCSGITDYSCLHVAPQIG